ncbi:MAG TPA: MFS transporter, partial [Gaiellaceae bacterium]
WVFLDQIGGASGWRYLFLAASFPAFLAFLARLNLPESPYWLARKGRTNEAAGVLEKITDQPVVADEISIPEEPRASLRELVSEKLRSRSAIIVLVWIALNISYYGLFLWLPFVLQAEKSFAINVYLLLTLSALSQFPGYAASIWLVERIGRKPTLILFLALGGVSGLTFALADTQAVYVASLFFVGFFNLGAWGAVYPYTAELFPTRVRSTAFGMVEGFGKGAAIGGPYLFGALIDWTGDTVWSLVFIALVMVVGAVAMLFGRETRGTKLA